MFSNSRVILPLNVHSTDSTTSHVALNGDSFSLPNENFFVRHM